MKRIEKNLFYSTNEGILFWVIGYADTSDRVTDIIRTLRAGANEFAAVAKGDVQAYEAPVLRGSVLFEVDGIDETTAREALRKASAKLPVKTRFVVRNG